MGKTKTAYKCCPTDSVFSCSEYGNKSLMELKEEYQ